MGRNKSKTLAAVLEAKGISRSTYSSRIKRGWTKEKALNESINHKVGRPRIQENSEPVKDEGPIKTEPGIDAIQPRGLKMIAETFEISDLEIRALIGNLVLENTVLKQKLILFRALERSWRTEGKI